MTARGPALGRFRCASIPSTFPSPETSPEPDMPSSVKLDVPAQGQKITIANGRLQVPDQPIIPFI